MAISKTRTLKEFTGTRLKLGAFLKMNQTYLRTVISSEVTAESLKAVDIIAQYKVLLNQLQKFVEAQKAYAVTDAILQADDYRDRLLGYIYMSIYHAAKLPMASSLYTDAHALYAALRPYKSVGKDEYMDESGKISGLIAMAKSAKMAPLFAKFGLTTAITELEAQNNFVITNAEGREQELADRRATKGDQSSKELRNDIVNLYKELTLRINAASVDGVEGIEALMGSLDATADHYRAIAASYASGKSGSGDDSDDDAPAPDGDQPAPGGDDVAPETVPEPDAENENSSKS